MRWACLCSARRSLACLLPRRFEGAEKLDWALRRAGLGVQEVSRTALCTRPPLVELLTELLTRCTYSDSAYASFVPASGGNYNDAAGTAGAEHEHLYDVDADAPDVHLDMPPPSSGAQGGAKTGYADA